MNAVVYDAGVLIAADRDGRRAWRLHHLLHDRRRSALVPATLIARVSRSARQARLAAFLRGCSIVPFDTSAAHAAGRLLAISHTSDIVDASVVELAIRAKAAIVTTDVDDIDHLAQASGKRLVVEAL